jgi:hypothetical protein
VFAGEEFRILVDKYLRQGLHKGVPPLFVDLRSLYKDPEKVYVIHGLVLQYVDALEKVGRFSEEGNRVFVIVINFINFGILHECMKLHYADLNQK